MTAHPLTSAADPAAASSPAPPGGAVSSFRTSALASAAELLDLAIADVQAIEPGLAVLERSLPIGDRGAIDLLARDAAGKLVVVAGGVEPDAILERSLDHYLWLSEHAPLVARLLAGRSVDLSSAPRLVLLAPSFSRAARRRASLLWNVPLILIEYRHVVSSAARGLLLERVFESALDREVARAAAITGETAVPRPIASAASALAPSNGPSASAVAAAAVAAGSSPPAQPPAAAAFTDASARLYPRAKERILKIDPRIELVEREDRSEFLFLHKTLVELRRAPDALWLRVPPAESAAPMRSERDLERELHAVIEKFFRLYLSGRAETTRQEPRPEDRAGSVDPLSPAKLTEEEIREFYRLEGGSGG